MPKQKNHKGLSKRVKITGTGKVKRSKAFAGHLMSSKNGKRCRALGKPAGMSTAMIRKTKAALSA
ncbi:MAG: 50S ribosomal protein L35 [Sedimentisphaerales bacterium]|nr:50S ribosomal protein L35 [Sedimentisphaerales bacterium]